ncbi:MAG: fimbrillin family protein [Candidatus Cryptobacteroides sp.]
MKKYIITSLLFTVIIASCSKNVQDQYLDNSYMHFVPCFSSTKATDSAFEAGDSFGIYAVEYADGIPSPLQISGNWANNSRAYLNGNTWTVEPKVWWKEETSFDVFAYYPYLENPNSVDNLLFQLELDQRNEGFTKSDLLYAKAKGVRQEDGDIELIFKHKLSRLDINLVKGDDYEGDLPATAEVHVLSTVSSAFLDLESGDIEKNPYANSSIILAKQTDVGKFSAIVVPQKFLTQVPLIEVIVNNVSYLYSSKFIFESGKRHTLNLTLTSNPDKVIINIGGGINNWN